MGVAFMNAGQESGGHTLDFHITDNGAEVKSRARRPAFYFSVSLRLALGKRVFEVWMMMRRN
jgi:hypothetical protein